MIPIKWGFVVYEIYIAVVQADLQMEYQKVRWGKYVFLTMIERKFVFVVCVFLKFYNSSKYRSDINIVPYAKSFISIRLLVKLVNIIS